MRVSRTRRCSPRSRIDEQIGVIRITRVVSAVAAGRILNPTTASSQIMGAVDGGIGMALHQETLTDHRFGRLMTHNLADYLVPVNADVHAIDVIFVEDKDDEIIRSASKTSVKSALSELRRRSRTRSTHATGKRVRDLPITLDKLMRDCDRSVSSWISRTALNS